MRIEKMQTYLDQILLRFGHGAAVINVLPTSIPIYACAEGCNPIVMPLQGSIYVNDSYLNQAIFTDSEIQFVLAHEYTHILKNHNLFIALGTGVEQLVKGPKNQYYCIVELLKAIIKPGEIVIKNQECDADWGAVEIIQDMKSAITCLQKLVNGDLEQPSHLWELYDTKIPAMSMSERITELKMRAQFKHPSSLY